MNSIDLAANDTDVTLSPAFKVAVEHPHTLEVLAHVCIRRAVEHGATWRDLIVAFQRPAAPCLGRSVDLAHYLGLQGTLRALEAGELDGTADEVVEAIAPLVDAIADGRDTPAWLRVKARCTMAAVLSGGETPEQVATNTRGAWAQLASDLIRDELAADEARALVERLGTLAAKFVLPVRAA